MTLPQKIFKKELKKMIKRRKKSNIYFSSKTENAIVLFNQESDEKKRSIIYKEKIDKPISKLVENIINRFKFPYFNGISENLKHDVVSFLVMNMDKYDPKKGRAFSYFSILAKNYLILGNNEHYKYKKMQHRINPTDIEHPFDIIDSDQYKMINDDTGEFVKLMIEYWDYNITEIFVKKQEIMIAEAILNLFKHINNIENYNKKALYIMIREMTSLKTSYITSVVNKMKKYNEILQKEFNKNGFFDITKNITPFF